MSIIELMGCVEIVEAIGGRSEGRVTTKGVSTDSRAVRPDDLFFALRGPNFDAHDYVADAFAGGAAGAVVSRSIEGLASDQHCILVKDTLRALGDLARAVRRKWNGKVIGITGSAGKTTCKDMSHAVLSRAVEAGKTPGNFNNHIGLPLSIFGLEPEHEVAILEMGASAAGEIADLADIARPDIGVVTNVGPAHLEGFGSLDGVARAKGELVDALGGDGVAVLNADNHRCLAMRGRCRGETVTFGLSEGADVRGVDVEYGEWDARFRLEGGGWFEIAVPGRHNVMNALAALAVGRVLGLADATMAEGLSEYGPAAMRMNLRRVGGVKLIDDTYNANPKSMAAALEVYRVVSVRGRRFMICGDMLELGPASRQLHEELGGRIAGAGIDGLWTVGEESRCVATGARRSGADMRITETCEAEEAADALLAELAPGDAVLVKGSRAIGLDRCVERLESALAAQVVSEGVA